MFIIRNGSHINYVFSYMTHRNHKGQNHWILSNAEDNHLHVYDKDFDSTKTFANEPCKKNTYTICLIGNVMKMRSVGMINPFWVAHLNGSLTDYVQIKQVSSIVLN